MNTTLKYVPDYHKEDNILIVPDLTIGDIAMLRMALQDSLKVAEQYYEKFVKEKKPKYVIEQAKWNVDQAREKISYFEDKFQYQHEWIQKYVKVNSHKFYEVCV